MVALRTLLILAASIGIITVANTGCSPQQNATFTNLANQGIVPVSGDNAYLGSNLFLSKEMEESVYLYNFVQRRGSPQAIELSGSSESSAELQLFYSDKGEVYKATPQINQRAKTKEWIVRGPYAIERTYWRQIASLPNEGGVFEIYGRKEIFGGKANTIEARIITPAFIPTPQPKPRKVKKKSTPIVKNQESVIRLPSGPPANLDQEALLEAQKKPAATPTAVKPTPSDKT